LEVEDAVEVDVEEAGVAVVALGEAAVEAMATNMFWIPQVKMHPLCHNSGSILEKNMQLSQPFRRSKLLI
jgi:hypothetical protein